MIQIIRNLPQAGIKIFVCDTKDELSNIDLRTTMMGSTCYVINNSTTYILNGSGTWVRKSVGANNLSSSGTAVGEDTEYSMDGGEII